ncbi:MAG: hypothetical protein WCG25_00400 [bacterium]
MRGSDLKKFFQNNFVLDLCILFNIFPHLIAKKFISYHSQIKPNSDSKNLKAFQLAHHKSNIFFHFFNLSFFITFKSLLKLDIVGALLDGKIQEIMT